MRIEKLLNYDFPEDMVSTWRKMGIAELQPIQVQAIQKYKLFDGNSMIVSAPTSSGKTFVGELAAVYQAIHEKKTAFLVPLKAIAEEKFKTFREMYQLSGIRVVVSSRDHKEFDADIDSGNFDIAIIVFEKFFQLLNSNRNFLGSLGLVVIDELQLLADPTRGTNLELILTHLRMQKKGTFQIVGLSAVLGNHTLVNEWLGIDLLHYERRPVELRIGYLYQGVYHYRSMNTHIDGDEVILSDPPDDRQGVLYAAVKKFAEDGEQTLLFLKDKSSVRGVARALAEILTCPPAENALAELATLEETQSTDDLAVLLQHGVAIHHADLTMEERDLVERYFRSHEIQALVSTSTLAMGVNLPTRNVFIELQKWYSDSSSRKPYTRSMTKSEFENMGGRAGRFQLEDQFGRAIALASSIIEREQIRHKYIEGQIENIVPCLWKTTMATTVLGIVSLGSSHSVEQVKEFIRNTLSWHVQTHDPAQLEQMERELERAIKICLHSQVMQEDAKGKLSLTPFGVAVSSYGIRVETAEVLREWLEQRGDTKIRLSEAILFAAMTEDGQDGFITFSTEEYKQLGSQYESAVRSQVSIQAQELFREMTRNTMEHYVAMKLFKTTMLLSDFVGTISNKTLERRYQVYFGTIKRVAEQISWVISAAASMVTVLELPEDWQTLLDRIALEVQYGVPEDGLYLAQLRIPRLGRERIRKLVNEGVTTESQVLETSLDVLGKLVTKSVAKALVTHIELQHEAEQEISEVDSTEASNEMGSANYNSKHNSGLIVNVTNGTVVIHHGASGELSTDAKNASKLDNLSDLPVHNWQLEVTKRLDTLTPDSLRELHDEIRAMRHNRIQPARDASRIAKTVQQLSDTASKLQSEYNSFSLILQDKLQAIILPTLDSDFAEFVKPRKGLEAIRTSFQSLLDSLTKYVTRIGNLVSRYKTTPEALLLEALTQCKPMMNGTQIDHSGLAPELDRTESFFARQNVVEAFSNLLRNAEASLTASQQPKIVFASYPKSERSVITIQDNGQGIPAKIQSSIFDDGFSTKDSDGFGLAHAKRTIESHGGSIRLVSSKPKVGTTFEVVL